MFVCCECCVLSVRGLCDELITRPEESYRLWRVAVCNQETSYARRLKPSRGLQNTHPQWVVAPVGKRKHRVEIKEYKKQTNFDNKEYNKINFGKQRLDGLNDHKIILTLLRSK